MPKCKDNIMVDLQYCETMLKGIIDNAQKIDIVETHGEGTQYEFKSHKYPSAKGYVKNDIIHLRRILNDIRKKLEGKE